MGRWAMFLISKRWSERGIFDEPINMHKGKYFKGNTTINLELSREILQLILIVKINTMKNINKEIQGEYKVF